MRRLLPLLLLLLGCDPDTGSGATGGEINAPAVCDAYCDIILTCTPGKDPGLKSDIDNCLVNDCITAFGAAASVDQQVCSILMERVIGCVGSTIDNCDDYDAWFDRKSPYACESEELELSLQCGL